MLRRKRIVTACAALLFAVMGHAQDTSSSPVHGQRAGRGIRRSPPSPGCHALAEARDRRREAHSGQLW
jgi:hypothetical protein